MFEKVKLDLNSQPILPTPSAEAVQAVKPEGRASQLLAQMEKEWRQYGSHLLHKATQLPREALDVFRDSAILLTLIDIFEMTARVCELGGSKSGQFAPYFAMITAPVYLFYACKDASKRLSLVRCAIRVSDASETLFWGSRAIDSVGAAIGDVAKGFAGGVKIAHIPTSYLLGVVFTMIIPILLVVTGSVGGVARGWALWRNAQALDTFKKEKEGTSEDLAKLLKALKYIRQGSRVVVDREDSDADRLARTRFQENHFSSDERRAEMEKRVDSLLADHEFRLLDAVKSTQPQIPIWTIQNPENAASEKLNDFISKVEKLFSKLIISQAELDEVIALYDSLDELIEELDTEGEMAAFTYKLKEMSQENRAALKQEGGEILDLIHSDMHRVILYNAFFLLLAAIGVATGTLILASPQHTYFAILMALGLGALDIAQILFNKKVTQKQFLEFEKFLHTIT